MTTVQLVEADKWWVPRDCGTDRVTVSTRGQMVDPAEPGRPPQSSLTAFECIGSYEPGDEVVFVRPDPADPVIDITNDTREVRTQTLLGIFAVVPFLVPWLCFLNGLLHEREAWFRLCRSVRLTWPFARPDAATARARWHAAYGGTDYLNAWDLWGLTRIFDDGEDVCRERDDRRRIQQQRRRRARARSKAAGRQMRHRDHLTE